MAQKLIALVFCLGLLLHGCGGDTGGDKPSAPLATPTTTTAPEPPPPNPVTPNPATPTPAPPPSPPLPMCLCVFDIDRTLTGKQGQVANCPSDKQFDGIYDAAYSGGTLLVSEGLLKLKESFCRDCYLGIISAGTASGPGSNERKKLVELLQEGGHLPVGLTEAWNPSGCAPSVQIVAPLVTSCQDETKHLSIPGIQKFYADKFNASVKDEQVYFFDDRHINIDPFKAYQSQHKYNARQISCRTRDDEIGMCGATLAEFKDAQKGISECKPPSREHSEAIALQVVV
mmetsp:Transcript_107082/g.167226  ORF Transcript_107082/g.167226 Transcript_107082/m.167226 type:complete len:286 (-) Transcript_107082:90-947(-)